MHPALKQKYRCPVAGILKYTFFKKKSQEIGAINPTTTAVFYTGNTAEDFRKKNPPQISNFMKNRSVGAQLLEGRTEGHTDMSRLIIAFCKFATALENEKPNIYDFVK